MKFDTLKYGYSSGALFCVRSFVLLGCNVHTRAHSITLYFQDSIEVAKLAVFAFSSVTNLLSLCTIKVFLVITLTLGGCCVRRNEFWK